jgi:acetyl-CoA acetyltransferase family protein
VVEAFHQMLAGESKVVVAGGAENMSQSPYLMKGARWGMRMGNSLAIDLLTESLTDSYAQAPMAITAENLAEKYKIPREEVDAFALRSQTLCKDALAHSRFAEELTPVSITDRKGATVTFAADEHPRPETTSETLAKLKPIFKKDGVVTAGNASGIVDGGAALVLASESETRARGWRPIGRLISYGISGCDPKIMGIGPVPAARQALKRAGMTLAQMDLIEINEAFAAQALAVERELGIPRELFNVNGGAVAIGHPLAATGARLTTHILHELRRRKKRYGLAGACIGGGQGIALVLEALH